MCRYDLDCGGVDCGACGDGEAMVFGWSNIATCTGDYCSPNNSLSSVDTKATWITSNSYHYNMGKVRVWVR